MGAELCHLLKETRGPEPKGTLVVPLILPVCPSVPVLSALEVPCTAGATSRQDSAPTLL